MLWFPKMIKLISNFLILILLFYSPAFSSDNKQEDYELIEKIITQGIIVVSLHPGWVKTDMGGPNAPVSIDESIKGMIKVIYATDIRDTGRFLNYNGKELPW